MHDESHLVQGQDDPRHLYKCIPWRQNNYGEERGEGRESINSCIIYGGEGEGGRLSENESTIPITAGGLNAIDKEGINKVLERRTSL